MNEKDHIFVEKSFHEEIFGKSVTFQMGPNANAIIGVDALMLIFISHEDCMKQNYLNHLQLPHYIRILSITAESFYYSRSCY